jgi:hypothetical protein
MLKSVKISVADLDRYSRGIYDPNKNEIILNSRYLQNEDKESIAKTILKEYVHALTTKEVKKYLDTKGNFQKGYSIDNVPTAIIQIRNSFKEYANTFSEEDFLDFEKRKAEENISLNDKITIYPATNIFEFMEVFFTEPQFQSKLSEIKKNNKNIFEKLITAIKNLFNDVFSQVKENTLSEEVLISIIKIIEIETNTTIEDEINKFILNNDNELSFDKKTEEKNNINDDISYDKKIPIQPPTTEYSKNINITKKDLLDLPNKKCN